MSNPLSIHKITTDGPALQQAIQLFQQYAAELNENLCFQSFDAELKNPLYKYGGPQQALLLAYHNGQAVGCVAITNISNHHDLPTCEMKRLYVLPAFRKLAVGKALVQAILEEATKAGYHKIKLDTLERLQAAIQLYLQFGFSITTAYYNNPLSQVVYMEKILV